MADKPEIVGYLCYFQDGNSLYLKDTDGLAILMAVIMIINTQDIEKLEDILGEISFNIYEKTATATNKQLMRNINAVETICDEIFLLNENLPQDKNEDTNAMLQHIYNLEEAIDNLMDNFIKPKNMQLFDTKSINIVGENLAAAHNMVHDFKSIIISAKVEIVAEKLQMLDSPTQDTIEQMQVLFNEISSLTANPQQADSFDEFKDYLTYAEYTMLDADLRLKFADVQNRIADIEKLKSQNISAEDKQELYLDLKISASILKQSLASYERFTAEHPACQHEYLPLLINAVKVLISKATKLTPSLLDSNQVQIPLRPISENKHVSTPSHMQYNKIHSGSLQDRTSSSNNEEKSDNPIEPDRKSNSPP